MIVLVLRQDHVILPLEIANVMMVFLVMIAQKNYVKVIALQDPIRDLVI